VRGEGRGRKTWNECVKSDTKRLGLIKEDALIIEISGGV